MAEIRFHSWGSPFLPAVAGTLVELYTRAGSLDLSQTLLVLPGSRGKRRLLEILIDRAEREGLILLPPSSLLTVGDLPEELYRPDLPLASDTEGRRAWALALDRIPVDLLEAVFGPQAREAKPVMRRGLAHLLFSLNRTVGGGALTFEHVARECRTGFLFSDEERWMALARIQEEFLSTLRDARRRDREDARRRALAEGRISSPGDLVLVGVAQMPRVVRRMVEACSGAVLSLVHAPEESREGFDALGLVKRGYWEKQRVPVEEGNLAVVDRPSDQGEEVLRSLRGFPEDLPPEDVTLGVPDPALVPFLAQHLEAHGVPYRIAEGTPMANAAPYRLLRAAADYLSPPIRFSALAALLRHPDLPVELALQGPEVADAHFREHLPDRLGPGTLPGESRGSGLSGIREVLDGPDLLGGFRGNRSLREWMPPILHLLARVYGGVPLSPARPVDRLNLEAILRIREAAEAIFRLPECLDMECTASEALDTLLAEVSGVRIPPGAEEEAVEMVGWLELQLDDAPILLLAGVNEPFLPESVNADPFLPNALRARLGLEDNQERLARDVYRMTAILHSRDRVRIIAGRRDGRGEPLKPSRILLTGEAEEVARRVLIFTEGEDGAGVTPGAGFPGLGGAMEGTFRLPPEDPIPLPSLPDPLPVTAFRAILEDPYLWVMEGVLELEEVGDDLQELDPLGFGTLAHGVLERFARTPEAVSDDPEGIRSRLDAILDRRATDLFGAAPLPTVPLQVEQLRARLGAFAEWQARWVAEGWRILAVEARTPPGGVPFDVDGRPVHLSGRIDRIDRHLETGDWMIFDYKTAEGGVKAESAHRKTGGWVDLQLPLYRHLLQDLRTTEGAPLPPPGEGADVKLAYLPLSRNPDPFEPSVASWTPGDLEDAYETAREAIRTLRRQGGVPFVPGKSGRRARGALEVLLGRECLEDAEGEE